MKKGIIVVVAIITLPTLYFLWPNNEDLPRLGKVDTFVLPSVYDDETYTVDNDKVKLVTFFYTNCPDICPLTMRNMALMKDELLMDGTFGEQVEFISITMDPVVDTSERIKSYAANFDGEDQGWKWLRGTEKDTKLVADRFKMLYEKSKDGFISHNTTVFLLDGKENIRGLYDMATSKEAMDTEKILEDIDELIDQKIRKVKNIYEQYLGTHPTSQSYTVLNSYELREDAIHEEKKEQYTEAYALHPTT